MNKGINFNSREENNTTSLTGYPSKDNPMLRMLLILKNIL